MGFLQEARAETWRRLRTALEHHFRTLARASMISSKRPDGTEETCAA